MYNATRNILTKRNLEKAPQNCLTRSVHFFKKLNSIKAQEHISSCMPIECDVTYLHNYLSSNKH